MTVSKRTFSGLPAGLAFFATDFDPLDLASDSIDPLGFLKGYLSLADRMLPGFTTVTSVPRYLPMLCAGLRAAERLHPRDDGREPAKSRGRRLEVLRNFEKLWALACCLAEETRGEPAVDGLRGIRSTRRFLASKAATSEISIGDFDLLSNQVRYGGIGTYGQMLEACHFVDWSTLALRPLGEDLADTFPFPPAWTAERPNVRIAKDLLRGWGEDACLEKMSPKEASAIRDGLSGGIEAERDDDVRWACLRLLKAAGAANDISEEDCLKRFCTLVEQEAPGDARKAAALRQLRVVVPLIEPFERFYQSALFVFDEVRASATENPAGCVLSSLDQPGRAADALMAAQKSERDLRSGLAAAEKVDATVVAPVAQAIRESGITALSASIAAAGSVSEAARILMVRHVAVQSGKYDHGQQKAPWLRLDSGTARLTSQRNELKRGKHAKAWRSIARHPYRTAGAGRFIQQCRIA